MSIYLTSYAQQCCYTNKLIINTGYDPVTTHSVTPGTNGGVAVPDPHWQVCHIDDDYIADINASTTPTLTPVATPGAADVIGTVTGWGIFPAAGAGGPGTWINCFNSTTFNHGVDGRWYYWVITRTFYLVCKADVTFDLYVAADNYMEHGYIDGVPCDNVSAHAIPNADEAHSTISPFQHLNGGPFTVLALAAGPHTISFALRNDNASLNNGGVAIYGTVSTVSAFLVPEGTCTSFTVCPKSGPSVCVGSTVTLSSSSTGGTWTSSDNTVATIGSSTGIVTGVTAGTADMTFTSFDGCTSITTITVNSLPSNIQGAGAICAGSTIPLSDVTSGGAWSCSNTSIATISSTGIVTGITGGSVTITYTLGTGCIATTTLAVNPNLPIAGITLLCATATVTLSDPQPGGTWSSSNTSIATVDGSGVVTGVSAGGVIITYTLSTGCIATLSLTVNPLPLPDPITGAIPICTNSTTTLSDDVSGGAWSCSNTSVATIGSSTGIVSGISGGTVIITYALSAGCIATTSLSVTPDPISGNTSVCISSSTILSDAVTGGTWASSNSSIATVDDITGTVYGVSAGTVVITYSLGTGCTTTITITVNPLPVAITGSILACAGLTITLSDGTGGGVWSSSNTSVATIGSSTGIVTGVTTGTITATYTLGTGCIATTTVTVITLSPTIPVTASECAGSATTLSDATSGGTWSSSNTSIATVDGGTGIVTGVATGTAIITYTFIAGCIATTTVTIISSPTAITGNILVCAGSTTTLSDDVPGGIWSSSNTSVAIIGSSTGIVTGLSGGTVNITYTLSTGCISTISVTVNPDLPITGITTLCEGSTTMLSDEIVGGVWTSANTAIATIDDSGIVTGISSGTTVITFTILTGCFATTTITVNPLPGTITGITSTCVGSTIILSDATGPGIWSSSNTSVATIGSGTGEVTGVSPGNSIITYTLSTGCMTTTTVTVLLSPTIIIGITSVCAGSTTTLSDDVPGGIWSSSNTSVAIIGSSTGIVTGLSGGTVNITYTLSTGCISTISVTVNPDLPITGITTLCEGSTTILSDAVPDGTWTSNNTSVATIDPGSGVVSGVIGGTTTITYTTTNGCTTTTTITVNPDLPISGITTVCAGYTTTLSDAVPGGAWSSDNTTIAIVEPSTGVVTGVSGGSVSITYTTAAGCIATITITINPDLPITGITALCEGSTTTLSNVVSGGVWTSSNTSIATITNMGVVTGVAVGTVTITYTLGTGCIATTTVTVNISPSSITGLSAVCVGSTISLSDATPDGAWASSNTSVATVDPVTGVVTGVSPGTTTITYAIGSCVTNKIITVNALPVAITGPTSVCAGSIIALSDATTLGTWSCSNSLIATVDPISGVVTGIATGTVTITYTLGTGCIATITITVNPIPTILGPTTVCLGSSITLSDIAPGGTWTSDNTLIATVGYTNGIVTSVTTGTVTITYTSPDGCVATYPLSVLTLPIVDIITPHEVYQGCSIMMIGIPGSASGTVAWSCSNTSIAALSTPTTTTTNSTVELTGIITGTVTVSYSVTNMCGTTTHTVTVTVLPYPDLSISGPVTICAGVTITLSTSLGGGVWSSSNTSVATTTDGGDVTGINPGGVSTLTYTLYLGSCILTATTTVTVNEQPDIIIAPYPSFVCTGLTISLSDITPGGAWSSSNTAIATVGTTGTVTGVSAGVVDISYIMPGGCFADQFVRVFQSPDPITGPFEMCLGASITLSDDISGGTWVSSNTSVAIIGSATGIVTSVSVGATYIFYLMPGGCWSEATAIVDPLPAAITGLSSVCSGSTISFSDITTGGTWSSSNTSVATIDAGGIMTGVSAGIVVITYSSAAGCIAVTTVTVTTTPGPITGPTGLCVGSTITLSDAVPGGVWSCGSTGIATVDPSTGIVTGVSVGTTIVTYTMGGSCFVTYSVYVDNLPVIDITGPLLDYVGCTMTIRGIQTLSTGTISVTWTSSNTSIATIITATVNPTESYATIYGITAGTITVTYSVTNVCGTISISEPVTILPLPVLSISGPISMCAGDVITLSSSPSGGTWSSDNTTIATVTLGPIGGGVLSGINPGILPDISVLTYTLYLYPSSCISTTSTIVTVNPMPTSITGYFAICSSGGTTTLSDDMTGGTWTSGNTTIATVDPGTGVLTALSTTGTVIITYTMPGGCFVTQTVFVAIDAPQCLCDYLATNPTAPIQAIDPTLTGILTGSFTVGGYYYLTHNVTINSYDYVLLEDCVVLMSPGVTITVSSGAMLETRHSHLFCCPGDMWQGIVLSNNNTVTMLPDATGQLILTNNIHGSTLIEDAYVAVQIPGPTNVAGYDPATPGTSLLTLVCNGVTFNKNITGIAIYGTPTAIIPVAGDPVSEHPGYPYLIENTIFTSRDFYGYVGSGGTPWPLAWPNNITGTGALKMPHYWFNPYTPPYYIEAYNWVPCNNSAYANYGIFLKGVGDFDATPGLGAEIFSSVVVGSPTSTSIAPGRNIFDRMAYGIYAINSNVVSRNCTYMHMVGSQKTASIGIYSYRDIGAADNGFLYKLDVFGNAYGYHNEFFDCETDVEADDLYNVRGIYSKMSGLHQTGYPFDNGVYGYKVNVSQYYQVELEYNDIYNITTGIHSFLHAPQPGANLFIGQMSINHNTIRASIYGGAITPYHEYVNTAIDVEALIYSGYFGTFVPFSQINTDHNTIDHTYNGIKVMNFSGEFQEKTSIGNTISIVSDLRSGTFNPYYIQAGIYHVKNIRDWIEGNNVRGTGAHVPAPPTPYYDIAYTPGPNNILEAIHCAAENATTVCNNNVHDINTGFYFGGFEGIQAWTNNSMQNNAYGYILNGNIGAQPNNSIYGYWWNYVAGNKWIGPWAGTDWQTYTIGSPVDFSLAAGSPMFVANTTTGWIKQNPTNNYADAIPPLGLPPLATDIYDLWPQGIQPDYTGTLPPVDCAAPPTGMVPPAYRPVVKKQMNYATNTQNKNWISQMSVWQHIATDSTVDTSAVLYSFKQMGANSRYKHLGNIENDITMGNYGSAATRLSYPLSYMANADTDATTGAAMADSAGDNVVINYKQYYQLLVKYQTDTLNSTDSMQIAAMANKCPFVDGSVIFQARALYSMVFNDSRIFSDVGCEPIMEARMAHSGGGDSTSGHTTKGDASYLSMTKNNDNLKGQQKYTLSPNPSDGNITLTQKSPDSNPVLGEVWNTTGLAVYKGELHFEGGVTRLIVMNASPGMYLLQLIDSNGNRFMLKFVISDK